jgi:hypothetical protein
MADAVFSTKFRLFIVDLHCGSGSNRWLASLISSSFYQTTTGSRLLRPAIAIQITRAVTSPASPGFFARLHDVMAAKWGNRTLVLQAICYPRLMTRENASMETDLSLKIQAPLCTVRLVRMARTDRHTASAFDAYFTE